MSDPSPEIHPNLRSNPTAHDDGGDDVETSEYVPASGRDDDDFMYHPIHGRHLDDGPPPKPKPEPSPWDQVHPDDVAALAQQFEKNNAQRARLGLPPIEVAHFDRVLREDGYDGLEREFHQLVAQTERMESRPRELTQDEKDLAEVTSYKPPAYDFEAAKEAELNRAVERGDFYALLKKQGALAPESTWGGRLPDQPEEPFTPQ